MSKIHMGLLATFEKKKKRRGGGLYGQAVFLGEGDWLEGDKLLPSRQQTKPPYAKIKACNWLHHSDNVSHNTWPTCRSYLHVQQQVIWSVCCCIWLSDSWSQVNDNDFFLPSACSILKCFSCTFHLLGLVSSDVPRKTGVCHILKFPRKNKKRCILEEVWEVKASPKLTAKMILD